MEAEQVNALTHQLADLDGRQQNCGGIFDFDTRKTRLTELNRLTEDPAVWDDNKRAQELGREKKMLESVVINLETISRQLQDARELFEMAEEEDDDPTLQSVAHDIGHLEKAVSDMEFRRMFSNPMDTNNCFVDIQSGSGGTEAQDWAAMLERMYLRYCERRGYEVEVMEDRGRSGGNQEREPQNIG